MNVIAKAAFVIMESVLRFPNAIVDIVQFRCKITTITIAIVVIFIVTVLYIVRPCSAYITAFGACLPVLTIIILRFDQPFVINKTKYSITDGANIPVVVFIGFLIATGTMTFFFHLAITDRTNLPVGIFAIVIVSNIIAVVLINHLAAGTFTPVTSAIGLIVAILMRYCLGCLTALANSPVGVFVVVIYKVVLCIALFVITTIALLPMVTVQGCPTCRIVVTPISVWFKFLANRANGVVSRGIIISLIDMVAYAILVEAFATDFVVLGLILPFPHTVSMLVVIYLVAARAVLPVIAIAILPTGAVFAVKPHIGFKSAGVTGNPVILTVIGIVGAGVRTFIDSFTALALIPVTVLICLIGFTVFVRCRFGLLTAVALHPVIILVIGIPLKVVQLGQLDDNTSVIAAEYYLK